MAITINMAEVVTAFANRHPGMCKLRTSHYDDSGLGWMKTAKVFDSRPMNTPWNNEMAFTFMSEDWRTPPVNGAPAYCITDRWLLDTARIGIAGDYEIKLFASGAPIMNYRAFGGRGGYLWGTPNNMLAQFPSSIQSDAVGLPVVCQWIDWLGQDGLQQSTSWVNHNRIDYIGERDTGAGIRWIISTCQDGNYPNECGHSQGYPYELSYFDLGPRAGVYDPEFGYIGYKHIYVGAGGVPNGKAAEEFYMNVQPGEYHRSIGNYLFV